MRRLVAVVVLFSAVLAPVQAHAGTPEDPDFIDVCAGAVDGFTPNVEWVDICRGWVEAGEERLDFTFELDSEDPAPMPFAFHVSWDAHDCEYRLSYREGMLTATSPPSPQTIAGFRVACGEQPCEGGLPVIACVEPVRHEEVSLDPDDVFSKTGDTVVMTLDLADEALGPLADEVAPGTTLAALYASASIGVDSISADACTGGSCASPFIDGAFGRDFTIPKSDQA